MNRNMHKLLRHIIRRTIKDALTHRQDVAERLTAELGHAIKPSRLRETIIRLDAKELTNES